MISKLQKKIPFKYKKVCGECTNARTVKKIKKLAIRPLQQNELCILRWAFKTIEYNGSIMSNQPNPFYFTQIKIDSINVILMCDFDMFDFQAFIFGDFCKKRKYSYCPGLNFGRFSSSEGSNVLPNFLRSAVYSNAIIVLHCFA